MPVALIKRSPSMLTCLLARGQVDRLCLSAAARGRREGKRATEGERTETSVNAKRQAACLRTQGGEPCGGCRLYRASPRRLRFRLRSSRRSLALLTVTAVAAA